MMWIFAPLLEQVEKIFPERPEHKLVRALTKENLETLVSPTNHGDFVALFSFSEPAVRALIHEAKFHRNEKAWSLLGEVLGQYLKHCSPDTKLIPIPLSSKRQRSRGYNQVEEVAKSALKHARHINLTTKILFRQHDTIPQTSLTRKERLTNVVNAFGVHNTNEIRSKNLIVLDDVATTGATLKAGRASLAPHQPSHITLLALAH